METINDRMEIIVNYMFNGNKSAFAKAIGLGSTGLSNYISKQRRSRPSVEMVINIVKVTGVSYSWLLTGEGARNLAEVGRPACVEQPKMQPCA